MYIRFAGLAILSLAVTIILYLFAWFIALPFFVEDRLGPINNNNGTGVEPRLRKWLWFADTPDNSLLGDAAWKNLEDRHWEWRSKLPAFIRSYVGRIGWLMRNPAYGFDRGPLRATIHPDAVVEATGDIWIQDRPNGKAGKCFVTVTNPDGTRYFQSYRVKDLGIVRGERRCFMLSVGWKLKTYAEDPTRTKTKPVAQFSLRPGLPRFIPSQQDT